MSSTTRNHHTLWASLAVGNTIALSVRSCCNAWPTVLGCTVAKLQLNYGKSGLANCWNQLVGLWSWSGGSKRQKMETAKSPLLPLPRGESIANLSSFTHLWSFVGMQDIQRKLRIWFPRKFDWRFDWLMPSKVASMLRYWRQMSGTRTDY